jgi:hypothetical protein
MKRPARPQLPNISALFGAVYRFFEMAALGPPFCRGMFFAPAIENHVEDHHITVEQRLGIAGY